MTNKVIQFFPSSFYFCENLVGNDYLNLLQNKINLIKEKTDKGANNWNCDTYNTLGSYDLITDNDFFKLLNIIGHKINEFNKLHNSRATYVIKESWLNIYKKGDYQEYHHHANSTYSAVYFLKSNKECAKIFFENPIEPEMLPIRDIEKENEMTFKRCHFEPIENSLLIFRSYMKHMVEQQKSDFERITIAINA
jgi:uncharacterized protein (TIGR02466 family)